MFVPNNFLEAKLRARVRALEAARDAVLVGDDDSGGALGLGGGGNIGGSFEGVREWGVRYRFVNASSDKGEGGTFRSASGRRRAALISERDLHESN